MLEFSSKHLENFKNSFVKFSEIFLTSWDSDTSAQKLKSKTLNENLQDWIYRSKSL